MATSPGGAEPRLARPDHESAPGDSSRAPGADHESTPPGAAPPGPRPAPAAKRAPAAPTRSWTAMVPICAANEPYVLELRLNTATTSPRSAARRSRLGPAPAAARLEQATDVGLGDDGQPGPEAAYGADLVGAQPGDVVGDALAQRAGQGAGGRGQPARLAQGHDLAKRGCPRRVSCGEHRERGLQIALGRPAVMGLGEALGGDELVLELGRVAVGERVPVRLPIQAPHDARPSGPGRGCRQRLREARRALEIESDDGQPARHPVRQHAQQRRRLAGPAGAEDHPVGGELAVLEHDRAAGAIAAQRHAAVALALRVMSPCRQPARGGSHGRGSDQSCDREPEPRRREEQQAAERGHGPPRRASSALGPSGSEVDCRPAHRWAPSSRSRPPRPPRRRPPSGDPSGRLSPPRLRVRSGLRATSGGRVGSASATRWT